MYVGVLMVSIITVWWVEKTRLLAWSASGVFEHWSEGHESIT